MSPVQAMTQAADKVAEKAVPVTEKVTTKIEEKAAQVSNWELALEGLHMCSSHTASPHLKEGDPSMSCAASGTPTVPD